MLDNLDVKVVEVQDIETKYFNFYGGLAKRNLSWVKTNVAHTVHNGPANDKAWHVWTKYLSYPSMKKMFANYWPGRQFNTGIDVGCGTVSFFDAVPCQEYFLVDIVPDYVDYMKEQGYPAIVGDINKKLPFEDHYFDIVVCSDILEHVLSLEGALDEVERIIKPDGVFAINIPWCQDVGHISLSEFSHLRTFDEKNLNQRLRINTKWRLMGTEVIKDPRWLTTINVVLTPLVLK